MMIKNSGKKRPETKSCARKESFLFHCRCLQDGDPYACEFMGFNAFGRYNGSRYVGQRAEIVVKKLRV